MLVVCSYKQVSEQLKEIKRYKLKEILRKSQPKLQQYVKKIETQAKNDFLIKKCVVYL